MLIFTLWPILSSIQTIIIHQKILKIIGLYGEKRTILIFPLTFTKYKYMIKVHS